jgi:hypothetical protein
MGNLRLHHEAKHDEDGEGERHDGDDRGYSPKKKATQMPDRRRQHKGQQDRYGERLKDDAAEIEDRENETHNDKGARDPDDRAFLRRLLSRR